MAFRARVRWAFLLCSIGGAAHAGSLLEGTTTLPVVKVECDTQEIGGEGILARFGIADRPGGNSFSDPANVYAGWVDINLHGTSSAGMDKKSYAIKLVDSADSSLKRPLLGMPSESKWVLVANHADKSLVRNAFAYAMASATGRYAPRNRYVDLVVGGVYQGVYLLTERVQRDPERVAVSKLDSSELEGDDLTGGYILRVDRSSDKTGWKSARDERVYYQHIYPDPEKIAPAQQAYIRGYMGAFEDNMASSGYADPDTGYSKWIDPGSFVDYLLIEELVKNVDGYRLSGYLHKDRNSKGGRLNAGPIWDLDFTGGLPNYYDGWKSTGWVYEWDARKSGDGSAIPFWWSKLAKEQVFRASLSCRWNALRSGEWSDVRWKSRLDSLVGIIRVAQERNFRRWNVLNKQQWPQKYVAGSYQGEVDTLENWLSARIAWIDQQLSTGCLVGVSPRGARGEGMAGFVRSGDRIWWSVRPARVFCVAADGHAVPLAVEGGTSDLTGLPSGVWRIVWTDVGDLAWKSRSLVK